MAYRYGGITLSWKSFGRCGIPVFLIIAITASPLLCTGCEQDENLPVKVGKEFLEMCFAGQPFDDAQTYMWANFPESPCPSLIRLLYTFLSNTLSSVKYIEAVPVSSLGDSEAVGESMNQLRDYLPNANFEMVVADAIDDTGSLYPKLQPGTT
jgi:hypothetical protein